MQLSKVKISNILGIDSLEFEAGQYIEISGRNGSGKTSVLEAIKAGLKGGNDVTLLRNGATTGEVAIEFDNGMVLQKLMNGKNKLKLTDSDGKTIEKPQSELDKLYDILSVNPVEFLTADKKSRARVLLESLPIEIKASEIQEILKGYTATLKMDLTGHPLELLDKMKDMIFGERREINRAVKEKGFAINQLSESMVELDFSPGLIDSQIKIIEEQQASRLMQREEFLDKVSEDLQTKLEEVERLKQEYIAKAQFAKEQINEKFNEKYMPAQEELARLKEQLKAVGGAMKTQELITQYNKEMSNLEAQSTELSLSLEKLEQIKLSKLENLPISGLEIKDGEIYKNGVIFDRLNTAEQIKVAVEVAKLRAGDLKLVCVDGLERFDATTYEMFKEQMLESGLQAIVTRVTNDDFEVN